MKKILLLIIDPQNDFCDPKGVLYVPGAEKDMNRLALMIENNISKISQIQVTLDSHQWTHIAHPIFWTNDRGKAPDPFTVIRLNDVLGDTPKWKARNSKFQTRAIEYVKALEKNGRYSLCIWPPHCIIGTWGHNIFPPLGKSLQAYQEGFRPLSYTLKGSNLFTEHYSAVKADVVDPHDASTNINLDIINKIEDADEVLISGEALSHCVANTMHDVLKHMGNKTAEKCVILEDTCSNIPGFEFVGKAFMEEMYKLGIRTSTTTTYFDEI